MKYKEKNRDHYIQYKKAKTETKFQIQMICPIFTSHLQT